MSVITLPSTWRVRSFALQQSVNLRAHTSPYGGSEQVIDMLNDRWMASLELAVSSHLDAASIEAFIAAQRNGVNTVNLYHHVRQQPRGTMRGTLTLSASAAAGASSLALTGGAASSTLLAGDVLGVGGLLVMVQDDATANGAGAITVNLVNRLRVAQSSGAAVTWNKPTAPFRLVGKPMVTYVPGYANSVALDFVEAVS